MEQKSQKQIDEALLANYGLYKNGYMSVSNYEAFLDCVRMAFGTEYIARRMVKLDLKEV